MNAPLLRARLVARLRTRLLRQGFPRAQMALIVALTGGAGFLASSLLLGAGLETMWLRYLCAFAVAYPVFLFLLWLWLRTRPEDYVDLPDLGQAVPSSGPSPGHLLDGVRVPAVGGGRFGGGGASAAFDASAASEAVADGMADGAGDVGEAAGEVLGAAGDADEFFVVLLVLILLAAVLASSIWLIYTAPGLFAELSVDGALSAGLYRRLKRSASNHWLATAVRRTALPFVVTALIVAACGWGLQHVAPTARSLGEAVAQSE